MNKFGGTYAIDGHQILWQRRPVTGADPRTFEPLNETWSRDGAHVFCQDRRTKANRATFVVLSAIYAKDKDHVYDYTSVVKGADAASFEVLRPDPEPEDEELCREYARDRSQVFHKVLTVGNVSVVRGASSTGFRAAGHGFGLDAEAVFFEQYRLPKCDPSSWIHLGLGHSRDRERVYHNNRPIAGADAATFEVLPSGVFGIWACDARHFYRFGAPTDSSEYWANFRAFTIFVGTVVGGEIVDRERRKVDSAETCGELLCHFTVRCDEPLQDGAAPPALLPAAGREFQFAYFNPLVRLVPERWIGRSRIWLCEVLPERGMLPASLNPAYFRTFSPSSWRANLASLIAKSPAQRSVDRRTTP
jgi:hypothetical protein